MHLQKGGCSMLERPGVECGEVRGVVEWEGGKGSSLIWGFQDVSWN